MGKLTNENRREIDANLDLLKSHIYESANNDFDLAPSERREKAYADLVEYYKDHYKNKSVLNSKLKKWFFALTFALVFLLTTGMIVLAIVGILSKFESQAFTATIITSIVGTISAVTIFPTIICNYLFPKNEDEPLTRFIIDMKKSDDEKNIDFDK